MKFFGFNLPTVVNDPKFMRMFPSPSKIKNLLLGFFRAKPSPIEEANPIEPIM